MTNRELQASRDVDLTPLINTLEPALEAGFKYLESRSRRKDIEIQYRAEAKKASLELDALKQQVKQNIVYLKQQSTNNVNARKVASKFASELLNTATTTIELIPHFHDNPEVLEQLISAATTAIKSASDFMHDKFPATQLNFIVE